MMNALIDTEIFIDEAGYEAKMKSAWRHQSSRERRLLAFAGDRPRRIHLARPRHLRRRH